MRIIDVVRPTAKQLATSAPARSPQGTNSPKAVWIIPPRRSLSPYSQNYCIFTLTLSMLTLSMTLFITMELSYALNG